MIWLIGNKGMLGSELAQVLAASGLEFAGSDREVKILDRKLSRVLPRARR